MSPHRVCIATPVVNITGLFIVGLNFREQPHRTKAVCFYCRSLSPCRRVRMLADLCVVSAMVVFVM